MTGVGKIFPLLLKVVFGSAVVLLGGCLVFTLIASYFLSGTSVVERVVGREEISDGCVIKCVREGNATVGRHSVFYVDEIRNENVILITRNEEVKVVSLRDKGCKFTPLSEETLLSVNNGLAHGWTARSIPEECCVMLTK